MSNTREKNKRIERSCRRCFAYIAADSRKCRYCGYVYKSSGKYLIDKIRSVLKIERAYTPNKTAPHAKQVQHFTPQEIENLLETADFQVMMYLVLDDVAFLDEMALIELGRTLIALDEN